MRTFAQKQNQPQKLVSSRRARPHTATLGPEHREHPILHLQRTIGNQAVQRLLQTHTEKPDVGLAAAASPRFGHDFSRIPIHPPPTGGIQAKLAISEPGDEYEQEADHISEQIMRMPEPQLQRTCACGGECPKCQTEHSAQEHERLQTKHIGSSNFGQPAVPPIGARRFGSAGETPAPIVKSLDGGNSLSAPLRAFFEPRLGRDLGDVRIHTDGNAAAAAQAVDALAFTIRRDVVFGAGEYRPDTYSGRRLLAHELVHVAQQRAGSTPAVLQRQSRTQWRPGKPLFYKSKQEAQNQLDYVKGLGKSDLLGLSGTIKIDPAGVVQEKDGLTFYYYPLNEAEAKAEKTTAETKIGRKDILIVEFSQRAQSYYLKPKCPDAAPPEAGWTGWTACFPTEAKANAQVKKFKDAHIEAKTGKLQEDQFYVLFKSLTEAEAKAKGEAEAKTRGGFAEGMFTVEPIPASGLGSFTYRIVTACPKGFKSRGRFKITSYFIADESQFPDEAEKDPCGLTGTFRKQFLHKTKGTPPLGVDMEGSGLTLSGKYINVAGKGCYKEVAQPLGKGNRPLTVGSSIAVDKSKIPIGSQMLIEDVGLRIADDVGGGIEGKEIDEYKGPFDQAKNTTLQNRLVCQKEKP